MGSLEQLQERYSFNHTAALVEDVHLSDQSCYGNQLMSKFSVRCFQGFFLIYSFKFHVQVVGAGRR